MRAWVGRAVQLLACCGLIGCGESAPSHEVELGAAGSGAWRRAVKSSEEWESEHHLIRDARGATILLAAGQGERVYAFWYPAEGGLAVAELAEFENGVRALASGLVPGELLVDPGGSGAWLYTPLPFSWCLTESGAGVLRYIDPWRASLVSYWPADAKSGSVPLAPELTHPSAPNGMSSCVLADPTDGSLTVFRTAPTRVAGDYTLAEGWRIRRAGGEVEPALYPTAVPGTGSPRLLGLRTPTGEVIELQWPRGATTVSDAGTFDGPFSAVSDEAGRVHIFGCGWSAQSGYSVIHLRETETGWHRQTVHALGRPQQNDTPPHLAVSACRGDEGGLVVAYADPYRGSVECARQQAQEWHVQEVARAELVAATDVMLRHGRIWVAYLDMDRCQARLVLCAAEKEVLGR